MNPMKDMNGNDVKQQQQQQQPPQPLPDQPVQMPLSMLMPPPPPLPLNQMQQLSGRQKRKLPGYPPLVPHKKHPTEGDYERMRFPEMETDAGYESPEPDDKPKRMWW
ncbi:uncharacterized protein DMAD_00334 [Drosophila madeirensis]|uniref:Uncharacterized protein n=1 Tax=Drosophila madeirensis TaxID=30013 RepID=A0AAU9FXV8_DROMD